jgi:hypothetical protein
MSTIMFTALIVKKGKGRYGAYAKEFPVTTEPVSTQREAIGKLKSAVLLRMEKTAERGTLPNVLEDAGYNPELIWFDKAKIESHPYDERPASIQLTRRLALLDRTKRNLTGDERNQA